MSESKEPPESLDTIGLKYAFNFGTGKKYTGGDKTSLKNNFTKHYDLLFAPSRSNKITLLELGILCGKSLAMWSDYFPNGLIYGIDSDLKPFHANEKDLRKHGAFANENVKVIERDLLDGTFKELILELPLFDIIIDDALHIPKVQFENFLQLFPRLNPAGHYIIEDIVDPLTFMTLFSNIFVCISNREHPKVKKNPCYSISHKIESIQIKQNMVIIKKI
ncbi:MAG: hypothetical protein Hyperionvirus11_42 [Hyperionvirus sp.]|uniref:Class I SAM-dependent methyltransferase n=1 Tax=Hyperionvirus sp. TaxID=2487770 RepID=A0A3G5AEH1_9VIRU|nr:MAG: hypothetical protein Hyperionvirus11_42 [Hyperionvirus sp.]